MLSDAVKRILIMLLLGGLSASGKWDWSWQDFLSAARTGVTTALVVSGITFVQELDAQDWGAADALVSGLAMFGIDFLRRMLKDYSGRGYYY